MIGTNYERTKLGNHLRVNDLTSAFARFFYPSLLRGASPSYGTGTAICSTDVGTNPHKYNVSPREFGNVLMIFRRQGAGRYGGYRM
jgi:hypothetical protein